MSYCLVSAPVTLSELGLAMVLLENELQNNTAEVNRLEARLDELNRTFSAALARRHETQTKLDRVMARVRSR